jgi:hypothetical protein
MRTLGWSPWRRVGGAAAPVGFYMFVAVKSRGGFNIGRPAVKGCYYFNFVQKACGIYVFFSHVSPILVLCSDHFLK